MLIECKECGAKVADSAPVCPHCGVPNPAGQTCQVTISRKRAMTGAVSTVEIYIDEKKLGHIKNGETVNLNLAPGKHQIQAVCTNPAGPAIRGGGAFEIHGGQSASFECGFNMLKGFYFK